MDLIESIEPLKLTEYKAYKRNQPEIKYFQL